MILALDTATRRISIALAEPERLVAEQTWGSDNNHTIELTPAVASLLAQAEVQPQDLTTIAVAIGPGSFTGVRIGLGFAKGLALAQALPLIGVRTLDITIRALPIAENYGIAVAQAGRSRVIWAEYAVENDSWRAAANGEVGEWKTVAEAAGAKQAVVVGEVDEAGLKVLQAAEVRVATPEQNVRRAAHLAEIGWERYRAGGAEAAATVQPIYAHQPTSGTQ